MKKIMLTLAILLVACFAFAQQNPLGQGPTILNGGIPESWTNIAPGAGPNNNGGPGLGRHDLYDGSTGLPLGCESCHLPHTAPIYGTSFLWAWKNVPTSISTYTTDTNPSGAMGPVVGRAASTRSILCFTCHDGVMANANAITGNVVLQGAPYNLTPTATGTTANISNEHPVDAIFPGPGDTDYQQPSPVNILNSPDSISGVVGANNLPLWDPAMKVECTTCHDQHNDYQSDMGTAGGVPFLRVANTNGVVLCRECHNQ